MAAFDPIFFLHHSNVDRLLDLWLSIKEVTEAGPVAYVTKEPINETEVNGDAEKGWKLLTSSDYALRPFRKAALAPGEPTTDEMFWNSNDLHNVEDLGYTYKPVSFVTSLYFQILCIVLTSQCAPLHTMLLVLCVRIADSAGGRSTKVRFLISEVGH